MSKGGQPAVPDYSGLAKQDYQQGLNTSRFNAGLNRIDQYGPTGSVTYKNNQTFNQGGFDQALRDWQARTAPQPGGGAPMLPPGNDSPGGVGSGSGGSASAGGTGIGGANAPGSGGADGPGSADAYSAAGDGRMHNMAMRQSLPVTSGPVGMPNGSGIPGSPDPSQFTTDNWSQTTTLSPEQQKLYESTTGVSQGMSDLAGGQLGRVGQSLGAALPNSAAPVSNVNGGTGYEGSRDQVVQALMARQMPGIMNQRHDLESGLLNSGIEKGTDAWNRAQFGQGQKENDMSMAALLAGGQEQSRLAGLDLSAGQFANSAAGQTFGQGLAARQVPLNELNGLRNGTNPQTAPQLPAYYTTGGGTAGGSQTEAAQNSFNAQSGAANAKNQSTNATYGAILSALATAFSDERLKTDIRTIGMHPVGIRRVMWKWRDTGRSGFGVIAQELQKVRPDAVLKSPMGYLMVNYAMIGGR